jgi:hypothetical protein
MVWNDDSSHLKRLSHAQLDVSDTEWLSDEGTTYPPEKYVNLVAEGNAGDEDHPLSQPWPELHQPMMEI